MLPFSLLYGVCVGIRNLFFLWGILPGEAFSIPVICVGNLSAGGNGKTPMVEYLIRLLGHRYRVAVISRGYKRLTKNFVIASEQSTALDLGDEAYQIKRKYPHVLVAVDANRRRAIHRLLKFPEEHRAEVILLDDGFQHRYVRPSLSLLVTDYHSPYYRDWLLPVGRLREGVGNARQAQLIVMTKCPTELAAIESRILTNRMNLYPHQAAFFSRVIYLPLRGVTPNAKCPKTLAHIPTNRSVLLLTGVASPTPLVEEVKKYTTQLAVMTFGDHHAFRAKDVRKLHTELQKLQGEPLVICTEKDAARIGNNPLFNDDLKRKICYVPVEAEFLFDKGKDFDNLILRHISTVQNSKMLHQ